MAIKLSSNTPSVEKETQATEHQVNTSEKPKSNKPQFVLGSIFLVLSIISLLMMGGIALAPYMVFVFGILVAAFWLIITVIPTCITLGLIWTSEGYKEFFHKVTNLMSDVWGSDALATVFDVCEKIYLSVLIAGGIFVIGSLILSIISKVTDKEKDGGKTAVLVVSIIVTILFTIAAFLSIGYLIGN